MVDLQATALRWLAAGRAAVVVEVRDAKGSVPRAAGTRMLVAADEVVGTVGGGHLELRAITDARALMARGLAAAGSDDAAARAVGAAPAVQQRIALGPSLGQCCGGVLTLCFTPLMGATPSEWAAPQARFELQLYGAGHVGRAIVQLLAGVACRVQWIDERESEFPSRSLPPHIQSLCVEPVQAEVAQAAPGSYFLVLTHSHELDMAITQAILARGDFGYLGLIGSQTKRARFEHRLLARGVSPQLLQRLVCPIGVPGITGKEPEVIAVAVVAQLLQAASR